MEFPGCVVGSELAVNACLLFLSRGQARHSNPIGFVYTAIKVRILWSIAQAVCSRAGARTPVRSVKDMARILSACI